MNITDTIPPTNDQEMPFGDVVLNQSVTESVTIENTSATEDLTLNRVSLVGYHFDDFEDGIAHYWQPRNRAGATGPEWSVVDGAYQGGPSNLTTGFKESGWRDQLFTDMEFEVTARHLAAPNTYLYMLVRNNPAANGSFLEGPNYAIAFTGNGGIIIYVRSAAGTLSILQDATFPLSLRPSPQPNTVRVRIQGNVLTVVINDHPWAQINNTTLSGQTGGVALAHSSALVNDISPVIAIDSVSIRNTTATNAFRLANRPVVPATINPDDSLSFDLVARATALGPLQGTLRILSSDLVAPEVMIPLSINGVAPEVGAMELTDSSAPIDDRLLEFPITEVGESSPGTITIHNPNSDFPTEVQEVQLLRSRVELFEDPAAPGWIPNGNLTATFDNLYGPWHVLEHGKDYYSLWSGVETEEGIFAADIVHTPAGASAASYMVFNSSPDFAPQSAGRAYMVGLAASGFFNIATEVNGTNYFIQPWTFNSAIKSDGSPNRLEVITADNRFRVRINEVQVADGLYPPYINRTSTMTGFGVRFFANSARIYFGNIRVDGVTGDPPFASNGMSLPAVIPPNESLQLPVTFAPTSGGRFDGLVRVISNSFPTPIEAVALFGTAPVGAVPFDFDGDGYITVADVSYLANSVMGLVSPLSVEEGDVNGDGVVDLQDATALSLIVVD